jgi:hypothetical protein
MKAHGSSKRCTANGAVIASRAVLSKIAITGAEQAFGKEFGGIICLKYC